MKYLALISLALASVGQAANSEQYTRIAKAAGGMNLELDHVYAFPLIQEARGPPVFLVVKVIGTVGNLEVDPYKFTRKSTEPRRTGSSSEIRLYWDCSATGNYKYDEKDGKLQPTKIKMTGKLKRYCRCNIY